MVEALSEPCGQEVSAVAKKGCALETTLGHDYEMPSHETKLAPIPKFYDGQTIFITGGTGFVGKLLIEKLLRGCPGISCIYLLVRPKKGKDVHQRTDELFEDPLFFKLKEEQPKFRHRVVVVAGDCSQPDLGISAKDRSTIVREVSIVFHVAATVRFNEKLKLAVSINVRSLKDVIALSKEMTELKSFVHVSTAYANCPQNWIEEKFYDPPMDAEKLLALTECVDEKLIDEMTPRLLGAWPNTYTYTKAVAESIVKKEAGNLPVGVFRPAIVVSTYCEPLPGWTDNLYGPTGVLAGAGAGIVRSIHCNGAIHANIVPGDLTTNALIVCAWDVANVRKPEDTGSGERLNPVPIYNYVSMDNPITYEELKNLCEKHGMEFPTTKAIWYYSFRNNKYRAAHMFCVYFLHLLPALLFDTAIFCLGKQPRLLKVYKKVHTYIDALKYFTTTEWKFSNGTLKTMIGKLTALDRENFPCDMKQVDWDLFFRSYMHGVRVYLLKDPIETLPEARVKWQRLYWSHQVIKLVLAYSFLRICWAVMFGALRLLRYF